MKLWIFVVLVLLVPGVAWAEVTGTPPLLSWTDGTDPMLEPDVWPVKDTTQTLCAAEWKVAHMVGGEGFCVAAAPLIQLIECNQRMEAAMRAIHKYVNDVREAYEYPAGTIYFKSSKTFLYELNEWDVIKRFCWKGQP